MSSVWVSSERSIVGYEVRTPDVGGIPVGWVQFERDLVGPWRAWCRIPRCHELGGYYSRTEAAEAVVDHWAVEHR
jgi:hypothetical protein